jgi:hypothetical protein
MLLREPVKKKKKKKKRRRLQNGLPKIPLKKDEIRLSGDLVPKTEMTSILREAGVLREDYAIHEYHAGEDPLYRIFYMPETRVNGELLIDLLLKAAYAQCQQTYGEDFSKLRIIRETFEILMESSDYLAKQMTLLAMIGTERSLQASLAQHYKGEEVKRLHRFCQDLPGILDVTLDTAYTDKPTEYNIDHLTMQFILRAMDKYD